MNYEQVFKNIDDILWKEAGCSNELDYVEQTSWILFLKYLDDLEATKWPCREKTTPTSSKKNSAGIPGPAQKHQKAK